jgi:hypothetical protein
VPDVDALTRLVADVAAAGSRIVSVWPRRDSLEDRFLREVRGGAGDGVEPREDAGGRS